MPRVGVFIDWQNACKSARYAFNLGRLPHERGNFSRYKRARILAAGNDRGGDGELVRVEIHQGLPSNARDRAGHGATAGKRARGCVRTTKS